MPPQVGEAIPAPAAKIAECTLEQIKYPLRFAMITVGLRAQNFPADAEKVVLVNFLRRHYPTYTPAEIAFAFELAMARRLDLENPSCFENFSCEYVGRVLSAYEKWDSRTPKSRSYSHHGHYLPYGLNPEREAAEKWYRRFMDGEFITFIPASVYNILVHDKAFAPLTGPEGQREYPKFLRVMRYFEWGKSANKPTIYVEVEQPLPENVIYVKSEQPVENPDELPF